MSTGNGNTIGVEPEKLWQAADKLRGSIDAAEYKHVVLGLLFLKYISDAFEARRDELKTELEADDIEGEALERQLEDRDEYTAENIFWVPPEARWEQLRNNAKQADIAKQIDDALYAIERDNPKLKGKLPRDYARRGIPPHRMGELIDMISGIGLGDADMRRSVRRLLNKYGYPPDLQEIATQLVIQQAELMAANVLSA